MSKSNPLYILWPLVVMVAPSALLIVLLTPQTLLHKYSLWGIITGWADAPVEMFAKTPLMGTVLYGALLLALLWWLRNPKLISGLALLLTGFFTGPAAYATLWILFSGKIGHS